MAKELEIQIVKALEHARDEIRANMAAKKINASGRTSDSIAVQVYNGGFRLVGGGKGAAPIPTLEYGRSGGKVPRGFYDILIQWSRDKGLQFASEQERHTFAYFLARKIAKEGSERFRKPETRQDVYSTPVMNAKTAIQQIIARETGNTLKAALSVTNIRGAFM